MNQLNPVTASDKVDQLERQVRDLTQINLALVDSMKWHLQGSADKAREILTTANRRLVKMLLRD